MTSPAKIALRAYAEASKGVRCPICNGIEGCDHTVRERLLADLDGASLARAEAAEYEAKRWKDVATKQASWETLWAEQVERAEAAEKREATLRKALTDIEYLDRPQIRGLPRRKSICDIALDALEAKS